MIENVNRFIAYICPECSGISDGFINVFDFSGNKPLSLICTDKNCKHEAGIITLKGDKMKLTLKCPVCTETHSYTISKSVFWSESLITFNCLNSGIAIFFAGGKKNVLEAVEESERMFDEDDTDIELLTDEIKAIFQTLDILHSVLEEKRMICRCGSRNLYPSVTNDRLFVECEDCQRKYPINPTQELMRLLSSSSDDFKL